MNHRVKRLWLDALRSGDYMQGQGVLTQRTPEGGLLHCCMGVLCDLAVKAGVVDPPVEPVVGSSVLRWHAEYFDYYNTVFPPTVVQEWAGIEREHVEAVPIATYLSRLNDQCDWTFDQVADWIEENL